jgi:hypothetical protein
LNPDFNTGKMGNPKGELDRLFCVLNLPPPLPRVVPCKIQTLDGTDEFSNLPRAPASGLSTNEIQNRDYSGSSFVRHHGLERRRLEVGLV